MGWSHMWKIPGTGIFFQKKTKIPVPGIFFQQQKKNPGYRDLQGKFFRRYAPDQNIDLRPNGGGADGIPGGSLL